VFAGSHGATTRGMPDWIALDGDMRLMDAGEPVEVE
jgi:hypothetical protein